MSYPALKWAWALDDLSAADKLVLVYLAYCQNGGTGIVNPSLNTIAKATGLDRRTVMRRLTALEAVGHVTRHQKRSPYGDFDQTFYTLGVGAQCPYPVGAERPYGRGTVPPKQEVTSPPPPPGGAVPLPSDWQPSSQQQATLAGLYPGVDLDASLRRFRSHFLGRPDRTHPNWEARYDAWIAEDAADPGHGPARRRAKRAPAGPSRADRVREHNRLVLERAMAETDEVAEDHPRRLEPPRHAG